MARATERVMEAAHPYRWAVLAVVFFAYAIVYIPRLCLPALAPFIRDDLLLTSAQIGALVSVHAMGTWVLQIPAGVAADRVGPRWILFGGLLFAFGATMLAAQASSYALLATFLFFAGWGSGCLSPTTAKIVMYWFPARERATVMGLKQAALNTGGVLAASTLPALATVLTWRFGMRSVALLALLTAISSLIFYKDPKYKVTPVTPTPATSNTTMAAPAVTRKTILKIFTHPEILKVSFAGMLVLFAESAVLTHTTLFMKDVLYFSAITAGMVLAWSEAAGAFGKVGMGVISDRLFRGSRKKPFLLSAITSLACCIVALFLSSSVPLIRGFSQNFYKSSLFQ